MGNGAQRIFLDLSLPGRPRASETRLAEGDLAELRHALDLDPLFRQRFDADPIAAAQAAGMRELALRLAWEMRELVALAERIASDDVYRAELDADPVAALVAAGMPAATAEPLLQALAVPEKLFAKLPEVVAHQHEQPPLRARLLMILLGSTAVVETIRSPARRAYLSGARLSFQPSLSTGATPWHDERAQNHASQQELQACREAPLPVPAEAVVKELPSARAQERKDVLEVRGGTRGGAKRRRIERASSRGEEEDARETTSDLEATRAEVLVRQAIAREMEDWPQEERRDSRPAGGAGRGACGYVECDDHG